MMNNALRFIMIILPMIAYIIAFLYVKSLAKSKIPNTVARRTFIKPILERLPFVFAPISGVILIFMNFDLTLRGVSLILLILKAVSILLSFILFFMTFPRLKKLYKELKGL